MKKLLPLMGLLALSTTLTSCDLVHRAESVASYYNQLEDEVITLRYQNLEQKAAMIELESEIAALKTKNKFLEVEIERSTVKRSGRSLASIAPELPMGEEDHVKFNVYRWSAE